MDVVEAGVTVGALEAVVNVDTTTRLKERSDIAVDEAGVSRR